MLDLTSLEKSVEALGKAVHLIDDTSVEKYPEDVLFVLKSGVVQHFEFTYELCWKYMKRILSEMVGKYAVEGLSRKELFRMAARYTLIDDPENWFVYHEARNITSHTYNQNYADEVAALASKLYGDACQLLVRMRKRND